MGIVLTLAVCYQLESVLKIGFVPAKKVGWGVGEFQHSVAGCRSALVGTGWTISHHVSKNGLCKNYSPSLGGAPLL